MTNYTIDTSYYNSDFVDALEKVFTRLGWMPELSDGEILVTVPTEDIWLFNILRDCDWF